MAALEEEGQAEKGVGVVVGTHVVVLQMVHMEEGPGSAAAETERVVALDVRTHKVEEEDPWVAHHTALAGLVELVLNHQPDLNQQLTLALEQQHPSVVDPQKDRMDARLEVVGEVG